MSQSNSQQSQQMSAMQTNLQQRAAFLANSKRVRKTLPTVNVVSGQSNYAIPLNNQGVLYGLDIEVTLDITAGAAAAAPNVGAPYNFFDNLNFVDQQGITRHNLSGRFLYDWLSFRSTRAAPFNASVSLAEGGGNVTGPAYPAAPSLAASGTGTVKFLLHMPIAKGWMNPVGGVVLQTGNQNQPAVLNLQLTNKLAGQADGPYNASISITGGSFVVHQCYWQPLAGAAVPMLDTSLQWALTQSQNDTTNIATGMQKQVNFQTQFLTSAVGIRFFNGTGFTYGTDISSVLLQSNGGTFNLDDDEPLLRYLRYRNGRGFDCAPGLYWFDFSDAPLLDAAVGVYSATFNITTAGSGSYMQYLYDWLKVPTALQSVPGINQIG